MVDIERDPKSFEQGAPEAAPEPGTPAPKTTESETAESRSEADLARTALKELVRSAGDALDGLLDDASAEARVETDRDEEADAVPGGEDFTDAVGESVEELDARAQEEAGSDEGEPSASDEDGLSEEESRLADEELGPAEFIEADRMQSIIESLLFTSQRPVSLATIKQIFKGSNVRSRDITRCLDQLASSYADITRGVTLEEVNGGYQLRTKVDNAEHLKRLSKTRPFRLTGPALETLSILAYKQPITKHEVDEIRGVESGHLVRALMERGLVGFQGKSEGPGKPMLYGTTRKFLETFGLRNIKELPTLAEIDELLPDGIGDDVEAEKPKLADLTEQMSETIRGTYSEGEEELQKITESLTAIDTNSEFFEQEKIRNREKRDAERAANIREALAVGEAVDDKDVKWLKRYEAKLAAPAGPAGEAEMEGEEFRKDIEGLSETMGATAEDVAESRNAAEAEFASDSDWDDSLDGAESPVDDDESDFDELKG